LASRRRAFGHENEENSFDFDGWLVPGGLKPTEGRSPIAWAS
jgi:hypothetical protein